MPIREIVVNLAAVGNTPIVAPGQRINAVSVTGLSAGATCALKLGNNPPFTIDGEGVLRIGSEALSNDAQQGLEVQNPIAQAGATVRLVVSYTRPGESGPNREIVYGQ